MLVREVEEDDQNYETDQCPVPGERNWTFLASSIVVISQYPG